MVELEERDLGRSELDLRGSVEHVELLVPFREFRPLGVESSESEVCKMQWREMIISCTPASYVEKASREEKEKRVAKTATHQLPIPSPTYDPSLYPHA